MTHAQMYPAMFDFVNRLQKDELDGNISMYLSLEFISGVRVIMHLAQIL